MANVNYVNPEAMYPLQSGQPNSGALGAGTTPGSFLAGFMLPDRMRDYEKVFGLSTTSSDLANQRTRAELEDYLASGVLRDTQRRRDVGATQNEIALQPGALSLGAKRQQGELSRVNTEEGVKLQKALSEMASGERQKTLSELFFASQMLNKFKDDRGRLVGDPRLISQEMNRYGVDVKPEHLEGLSRFNPEELKHMMEMEKETFKETQHTGRQLEMNETALEVARIGAGKGTASGAKIKRDMELDAEVEPILEKIAEGKEISAKEWAKLKIWQARTQEATARAGAKALGGAEEGTGALDILRGKEPKITTTPKPETGTVEKPKGKETMDIPGVGQVEVITREGNKIRIYDPKSGRFGWYEP